MNTNGTNNAVVMRKLATYIRPNPNLRTISPNGARAVVGGPPGGREITTTANPYTTMLPMPSTRNANRQPSVRISHSLTGTKRSVPSPIPPV